MRIILKNLTSIELFVVISYIGELLEAIVPNSARNKVNISGGIVVERVDALTRRYCATKKILRSYYLANILLYCY